MIIGVIIRVRGVVFASIVVLGIFVTVTNSTDKAEYDKTTEYIEYFDKEFQNLRTQHKGDFRYFKVNSYPYLFEIHEPNSEDQSQ